MIKIKDISQIAAKIIYDIYREHPSSYFNFKKFFEVLKENNQELTKNDFIVMMNYLEEKRLIKTEKFIGSEMSWLFKPTAILIDKIEG